MRKFSVLVLAALLAPAAVWAEAFVPLFNGKDLSGWEGKDALWSVADGLIVGTSHGVELEHNEFLFSEKEYANFVLRVKVKLENGNSGIQFRSVKHADGTASGYQADVAEKTYFGMLYEEKLRGILPYWNEKSEEERVKIATEVAKHGDWNEYEITADGDRVIMTLNGTVTCDIVDPEGRKHGRIALQVHTGPEMRVFFKDIEIRDLDAERAAEAPSEPAAAEDKQSLLMPDVDETRSEKLEVTGARYRVPEGFSIEQVATDELIGSMINMTFDAQGRPVLGAEKEGVWILKDDDGDGTYDSKHAFNMDVSTVMGLYFLEAGDLLVQANGPEGPGLYRLQDADGDDVAEKITRIQRSDGGMGEHGPHAITRGPDGYIYVLYGNHAHPLRQVDPASPYRDYDEDHLLPRYVDPRGHANNVMAPGGTVQRVHPDLDKNEWHQFCGGYRNAYDFSIDLTGEIFTFDSDMEWDRGLPWFRPIRVVHSVQGADYGWRTGSSKMPDNYLDTLPPTDDVGRGSPVGTAFYYHNVYPERFKGAFFMGDWSRGRIRVIFPEKAGATFSGDTMDFVLGEPLNVTDLDVAPDGHLYFTNGGRGTHGGMFRVRYTGEGMPKGDHPVVDQPEPRSAWGHAALAKVKEEWGVKKWDNDLTALALDPGQPAEARLRALEALQIHGPAPRPNTLEQLQSDRDPLVRAQAVYLLGASSREVPLAMIATSLDDMDPAVRRRACEALVRRIGAGPAHGDDLSPIAAKLLAQLDHEDRFLRYAARLALMRIDDALWHEAVLTADFASTPGIVLEGGLGILMGTKDPEAHGRVQSALAKVPVAALDEATLLRYLRVLQMAFIRDTQQDRDTIALADAVGPALLGRFPSENLPLNREIQIMLAHLETPGAADALLAYLDAGHSQEEQIHTVYCLRTIEEGWSKPQRQQLAAWFDRGRQMTGAASMEGFINNLWDSSLALMPRDEAVIAELRKEKDLERRRKEALALMAQAAEGQEQQASTELAQMSFEELAEYLEYDPMAYKPGGLENGQAVFIKAKCAACHVFGTVGRGGGPDLSTVTSRFRRRDILEAIVYPSKVVSDQYIGVEVKTNDGQTHLGMLAGENDETLTMISPYGERVELAKADIAERKEASASIMPEGLLNTMSMGELVDLIKYLEQGADPDAEVAAAN